MEFFRARGVFYVLNNSIKNANRFSEGNFKKMNGTMYLLYLSIGLNNILINYGLKWERTKFSLCPFPFQTIVIDNSV